MNRWDDLPPFVIVWLILLATVGLINLNINKDKDKETDPKPSGYQKTTEATQGEKAVSIRTKND